MEFKLHFEVCRKGVKLPQTLRPCRIISTKGRTSAAPNEEKGTNCEEIFGLELVVNRLLKRLGVQYIGFQPSDKHLQDHWQPNVTG